MTSLLSENVEIHYRCLPCVIFRNQTLCVMMKSIARVVNVYEGATDTAGTR